MDEPARTWVIAQTKPNSYRIAEENLQRQGFVTFFPLIEETRRRGTQFVRKQAPVFPGYVFVAVEPGAAQRWHSINATRGITKLVSIGAQPAIVPALLIDALRDRFDATLETSDMGLAEGDVVRVGSGPFTDLVGRIESVEPNDRIWVVLKLLGRNSQVSLHARTVRKS